MLEKDLMNKVYPIFYCNFITQLELVIFARKTINRLRVIDFAVQ